ncbi:MAG: hypothetical protein EU981_00085 [Candidatus Liberibacter ctenarytainae]|uniref:Flagellar protein FlgJ N-terminal domain-containing protein n=1 Tax=Candidatus Liberibacter ctenarytainae TaxID=2020335 RepID=A0A937APD1_9HYPH|nr:hypothetical protein [Candidatus Liberibacter ctenarytainae]
MEVSSVSVLQNINNDFMKNSRNQLSSDSFISVLQENSSQQDLDKAAFDLDSVQKLQGIMFQYLIKSILPEETVKSLGGGFGGDFWKEILAENISSAVVKQQTRALHFRSDFTKSKP